MRQLTYARAQRRDISLRCGKGSLDFLVEAEFVLPSVIWQRALRVAAARRGARVIDITRAHVTSYV